MNKLYIVFILIFTSLAVVNALEFANPSLPKLERPVSTTSSTSNSNSTFNQTLSDTLYWRLDSANDPPTSNWNMGGWGFQNLGDTNQTGRMMVRFGASQEYYSVSGNLVGLINFVGTSFGFRAQNGANFQFEAENGTAIAINSLTTTTDTTIGSLLEYDSFKIEGDNGQATFKRNLTAPNICYSNGTGCLVNNSIFNSTYNNLLNQNCPNGQVVNGTLSNGTFICTTDQTGSGNANFTNVAFLNNTQTFTGNNNFLEINSSCTGTLGYCSFGEPITSATAGSTDTVFIGTKSTTTATNRGLFVLMEYDEAGSSGSPQFGLNSFAYKVGGGTLTGTGNGLSAGSYQSRINGTGGSIAATGGVASGCNLLNGNLDNITNCYAYRTQTAINGGKIRNYTHYWAVAPTGTDTYEMIRGFYMDDMSSFQNVTGITIEGTNAPSKINSNLTVNNYLNTQNITPTATKTYSLGTADLKWKEAFIVNLTTGDIIFSNGMYFREPDTTQTCMYNSSNSQIACFTQNNTFMATKLLGDGSQLTNIAGGNASWNQSLANTLYSSITWNYNQTTAANSYSDATFLRIGENSTIARAGVSNVNCSAGQLIQNVTVRTNSTGVFVTTQCVTDQTSGGGGGNPFNQVLNTTSNVTFSNVTISKNSYFAENISGQWYFGSVRDPNKWTNYTTAETSDTAGTNFKTIGMGTSLTASSTYLVDCTFLTYSAAATTGEQLNVSFTGTAPTTVALSFNSQVSATTRTSFQGTSTVSNAFLDTGSAGINIRDVTFLGGYIITGAGAATVNYAMKTEVATSNAAYAVGSRCRYERVA